MYTREKLRQDFEDLGVRAGDVVMLHASVRAVGPVTGGPDQIHLALRDVLSPAGTLLMYASCPEHVDEVGRGVHSPEVERLILDTLPAFDPLTARSARDNGALVELFRTYPGSQVNQHVVRYVAAGAHAPHLLSAQPWNYAYGAGSVLERFLEIEGQILLLGCDHDAVTFLHYAEHIVDIPGKRTVRFKVPIEEGGCRVWREMEEIDTSAGAHAHWPDRFFARLVDSWLQQNENRGGRVGSADAYLIPARGLLEFALPVMRGVAADASAVDTLLDTR